VSAPKKKKKSNFAKENDGPTWHTHLNTP